MLGKYKAVLALLLLIILVPLTLLMTLGLWVPTLAGIWLPLGTRIALDESPRITRKGLIIPDLRYLVGDCQLAHITNASLSHPSRWLLSVGTVELDSACLAKLPQKSGRGRPPCNCRRRSNRQPLQKPSRSGSPCCLTPGSISIN